MEPGCYIDSHHGHYAIPGVIKLAQGQGFTIDPFAEYALASYEAHSYEAHYPMDSLIELSDEAIDWLNQHEGLPGHWWQWNDGDFGLYAEEDVD